jgi:aryl-alcohol dehydrogenase-like predicted oxidoreductase
MKSFPRRQLGKTSARPSAIGLGTGALGGFGVSVDYPLFEQTILAAYNNGVRYFDTAPMYGYGKSEHYLGHALRTLGLRNEVTLSSKVGRVLKPAGRLLASAPDYGVGWADSLPFRDTFDYSYDGIMRSFEDSQQRLGLDHLDILSCTILAAAGMASPLPLIGNSYVRAVIAPSRSCGAPARPALSDLASTRRKPSCRRRRNSRSTAP